MGVEFTLKGVEKAKIEEFEDDKEFEKGLADALVETLKTKKNVSDEIKATAKFEVKKTQPNVDHVDVNVVFEIRGNNAIVIDITKYVIEANFFEDSAVQKKIKEKAAVELDQVVVGKVTVVKPIGYVSVGLTLEKVDKTKSDEIKEWENDGDFKKKVAEEFVQVTLNDTQEFKLDVSVNFSFDSKEEKDLKEGDEDAKDMSGKILLGITGKIVAPVGEVTVGEVVKAVKENDVLFVNSTLQELIAEKAGKAVALGKASATEGTTTTTTKLMRTSIKVEFTLTDVDKAKIEKFEED